MTTEAEQSEQLRVKLVYYLKGDIAAVDFCMAIIYVAHLWDDLIDGDRQRSAL